DRFAPGTDSPVACRRKEILLSACAVAREEQGPLVRRSGRAALEKRTVHARPEIFDRTDNAGRIVLRCVKRRTAEADHDEYAGGDGAFLDTGSMVVNHADR